MTEQFCPHHDGAAPTSHLGVCSKVLYGVLGTLTEHGRSRPGICGGWGGEGGGGWGGLDHTALHRRLLVPICNSWVREPGGRRKIGIGAAAGRRRPPSAAPRADRPALRPCNAPNGAGGGGRGGAGASSRATRSRWTSSWRTARRTATSGSRSTRSGHRSSAPS